MHAPKIRKHPNHPHRLSLRPTVELLEPRLLLSGVEESYSYWGVAYPDGVSDQTQLVNVNATTGDVTWVGSPMSDPSQIHGLIVTNDGQFYGVNSSPDAHGLYTIDRDSGQATLVGRTDYYLAGGLTYDPNTDTIYGLGKLTQDAPVMQLAVFDRSTGDVSLVGPGSILFHEPVGLTWAVSEVLGFDQSQNGFFRVNKYGEFASLGGVYPLPGVSGGLARANGDAVLPLRNPYHKQLLGYFDPATGQPTDDTLLLSEPVGFYALEYALLPASTPGLNGQSQYAYIGIARPDPPGGQPQLMMIDPDTGQITWLGNPLTGTDRLDGLIVTNDGELYGINGPTNEFYSVDWETGAATLVGHSGFVVAWGLCYDPGTDTIYGLGRPASEENRNTLLIYDRHTGAGTPVGPGADDINGTTGIAWDATNSQVIVFDSSDEEFYSFDTAGNATLLSTLSQSIVAFGVAHNGQYAVMPLGDLPVDDPDKNWNFGYFDPDTGKRSNETLRLSQPVVFNALDYGAVPASVPGSNGQPQYVGIGWSPAPYHRYQLLTIEPGTGQVTWHGSELANPNALHAMVLTNDGELYGINGSTGAFYSVDWETGQPTFVGDSGFALAYGMAYDPAADTIYGLGKPSPADTVNTLLIYDRNTGAATAVGPGIDGMTGTSGLAWDAANERVIAFDNSDDEFYSFDTAGNATLLSTAEDRINTWGMAYRGDRLVMPLGVNFAFDRQFAFYEPTYGIRVGEMLRLSEPMIFEALEYLDNAMPRVSIVDVEPEGSSSYRIFFDAFDSDSNARVSLYYDDDKQGLDGQLIVEGLAENDGAREYLWDATDVERGEYYIYAVIDDGLNLPQNAYSALSMEHAYTGIQGKVFRDYNANGVWDGDEPGVASHEVYLDLNNDRDHDAGEPITTSLSDDPTTQLNEEGLFRFVELVPGDYWVRQAIPYAVEQTRPEGGVGYLVTVVDGQMESDNDFGNRSRLQNPLDRFDVTGNTLVSPLDVVTIIRWLNLSGTQLPESAPDYLDVNGDVRISPLDVLLVIRHLNGIDGEGESGLPETARQSDASLTVNTGLEVQNPGLAVVTQATQSRTQLHRAVRHALRDELFAMPSLLTGFPKLNTETWNELAENQTVRDLLLAWDDTDLTHFRGLDEDLCELLSIS